MANRMNLQELIVWQECRNLRKLVSTISKELPIEEKYRLKDQSIRSSRSITANIAEGYGRFHYQENIQYCRQARGSLIETLDHMICALDESFITEEQFNSFNVLYEHCLRLLNGYISYLKKAKEDDSK
jgi:four helix bundle protein